MFSCDLRSLLHSSCFWILRAESLLELCGYILRNYRFPIVYYARLRILSPLLGFLIFSITLSSNPCHHYWVWLDTALCGILRHTLPSTCQLLIWIAAAHFSGSRVYTTTMIFETLFNCPSIFLLLSFMNSTFFGSLIAFISFLQMNSSIMLNNIISYHKVTSGF